MAKRFRLDQLMVERGLAPDQEKAKRLVMAGEVLVDDRPADKPGGPFPTNVAIRLRKKKKEWVSRGALKLLKAFETWPIDVAGKICMDVGASTGGFTDVLLHKGAARVHAVDVGYGQLAWKLREDPRVAVLERANVRDLTDEQIPEPVDFLVLDVSFISLTKALPPALRFLQPDSSGVALIKPQFEAPKEQVGPGGVIDDPEVKRNAIEKIEAAARTMGLEPQGTVPSPLLGPKGNEEFLFYFKKPD